jgi:hypothetical protein
MHARACAGEVRWIRTRLCKTRCDKPFGTYNPLEQERKEVCNQPNCSGAHQHSIRIFLSQFLPAKNDFRDFFVPRHLELFQPMAVGLLLRWLVRKAARLRSSNNVAMIDCCWAELTRPRHRGHPLEAGPLKWTCSC